jgi:hypothetical protein
MMTAGAAPAEWVISLLGIALEPSHHANKCLHLLGCGQGPDNLIGQ